MARSSWDRIGQLALLVVWFAAHIGALLSEQQWSGTVWIIVLTPLYAWIVYWLDTRLTLGGMGSHLRTFKPPSPLTLAGLFVRERSTLASQTVAITTGFAALLFFNTVRFRSDLRFENRLNPEWETILTCSAVGFCLACVLNLTQLLILRLLDRHEFTEASKRRLRQILRVLSLISWHSLVTAVVLLLMLRETPLLALVVNAVYGLCLFAYYFCVPKRLQRRGDSLSAMEPRRSGTEPAPTMSR